ncbi:Adult-specific cuticular protein ACP-20 [Amphibalanus amphitrite]|uniref:Adult-specific cuticular protein ACP-20 n=1 Tax=Amphibalanus amphitrite TaxID=1232801 RepID=A0A6A4X531_AMPAM|nr:Adult-specific cuticular protein ACP-20 [Amphibalanus amphitrite]
MKTFIVAALVATAAASGISPILSGTGALAVPALAGRGLGYGKAIGYGKAVAVDYAEPRPYQYQYAIDDPNYGPMAAKQEVSDGAGNVQGSYSVNLPDGRTQTVKYVADGYSGFNAEVSYEGYAQHPQVARGYGIGGVGVGAVKKVAAVRPLIATKRVSLLGGGISTGAGLGLLGGKRIGAIGAGAGLGLVGRPIGVAKTGLGLVGRPIGLNTLAYGH